MWGDFFSPETRTILAMIKMGQTKDFEFKEVDQFKGAHKSADYLATNPTGTIPTIKESRFLILGGYVVFLNYLINYHHTIRERLCPKEEK